jgi:hypothetical protein
VGIFSTILFAAAALAAVMTILSTIRVYGVEFAGLREQLATADTMQLIVWRAIDMPQYQQNLQAVAEPKVQSRPVGPIVQDLWAPAPLPSLAA